MLPFYPSVNYTLYMRFATLPLAAAYEEVAAALTQAVRTHTHVLWFVSGGSCIEPQTAIVHQLTNDQISHLTILLADERFGPAGHADANYAKLQAAGFKHPGLQFEDPLSGNIPFSAAVARYSDVVQRALAQADIVVATLGIGQDGHTAGILPRSAAAYDDISTVIGYEGPDFIRMTVGFSMLSQIKKAFVFAYGAAKQEALLRLQEGAASSPELPSMILYDMDVVTIYNDSIESEGAT
jgi:6-phosphogluconolactonase/glucosamine-6-phosphate isomerase/deaminase